MRRVYNSCSHISLGGEFGMGWSGSRYGERESLVRESVSGCVERLADRSTRQTLGLDDRTTESRVWYLYPKDGKRADA
jgi:hypothetical protein